MQRRKIAAGFIQLRSSGRAWYRERLGFCLRTALFLICSAYGPNFLAVPEAVSQTHDDADVSLDRAVELHAIGEREEAYAAFREVLNDAIHAFGHEDYPLAEDLFLSWLSHFEQLQGEDLSNLDLPRSYLARTVAELDGPASARATALEVFDAMDFETQVLTDERAATLLNVGLVLLANDDLERAELSLERSVYIVQEMPAAPTSLHLEALGALRSLRLSQGRISEARSIGPVRMQQLRTRSENDALLAEAFHSLDTAHRIRQAPNPDYRAVSANMGRTVEILSTYLGPHDPELLMIQLEQGQALLVQKDSIMTGRHLITEAIEALKTEPSLNRLYLARALSVLAIADAQQGDLASAQELLEESLALYAEDNAQDSSGFEAARTNLCRVVNLRGLQHGLCP